jgi:murein L,D-transpeptidase YcbB/YkuD
MVNPRLRRPCGAIAMAAPLIAGLALASCATQPSAKAQTSTRSAVTTAAMYTMVDAALRGVLSEPAGVLANAAGESRAAIQAFYAQNGYSPLWVAAGGLTARGMQLLYALQRAHDAGAPGLDAIMAEIDARRQPATLQATAELEALLSAALLEAAVNPLDPTQRAPVAELLTAAADASDANRFFAERLPPDPAFWRLRDAVAIYRDIVSAGGWPTVPKGPKIEPGMRGPRVAAVRARLAASGELPEDMVASDEYDDALRVAVENFQRRHGLAADALIGPGTLEALNVSAEARLESMLVNLQRLQRQARDWGDTYIAVNTAAARYQLVDGGRVVFDEVTVVGQPTWRTPEIHSEIERIELNPFWTVPPRIARLELAEEIAKDPQYLEKNNMRLVGDVYRQDPGPGNALGKAKFLFPNRYDVYLHDTNSHRLFKRDARFLSHGCVRIPNAVELAEYLLKDDPNWTRERIDAAIGRGKNRAIALDRPMPIHIVYDTAWVDQSGAVHFRKDVYGRDGTAIAAAE